MKKADKRESIAIRFSRWYFAETFSRFTFFNIILVTFFITAVISVGENRVITKKDVSYAVSSTAPAYGGFTVNIPFIAPRDYRREIIYVPYPLLSPHINNSILIYRAWEPRENGYAVYDCDLSDMYRLSFKFLTVLLIFEVIMILGSLGKASKAAHKALRPLAELTETAMNINKTPIRPANEPPNKQLRDIAGKLDAINASKLDTRISVGASQNELAGLAEAINGMLDRINESYNSQVRFVSDASHELRTPIAVIQGYANLLDRWGKNDEKVLQESIETIKSEAQNMKNLVEQLLFLARGDNESMRLNIETLEINAVVREVIRETEMIAPSHTIAYEFADETVYVSGDVQLIKQALRIFMDNSIKYTPENEKVGVKVFTADEKVKISVSDNGIGIPPKDLPHIFDRFFRSDESRARKTGGSGLGLSIAKWIIERHSGSVEVISRQDIGTKVTLSLDAVQNPNPET